MTSVSQASSLIKFDLSEVTAGNPDFQYSNGSFGTVDDGIAATAGQQNSGFEFVGFLDALLTDVLDGASFTLTNVFADGAAQVNGSLVAQQTTGGVFSLFDQDNNLLLEGELSSGSLIGSRESSSGSFFNTTFATFTAGSLLPLLVIDTAGLSIALGDILAAGTAGLKVTDGLLENFVAAGDGIVTGDQIPEPTTVLLLLSGLGGAFYFRRQSV